jgi:copper chaperone CopZ
MKHTYAITGMTCATCAETIHKLLIQVPGVTSVAITQNPPQAVIEMQSHIPLAVLQEALKAHPRYSIAEAAAPAVSSFTEADEKTKTFWESYKPILLVFAFITGVTLLIEAGANAFVWERWMRHFMAGFFLVFSFFKLLDLKGFAMNYLSYDIIAKRWMGWGYVYAFIELILGLLFLTNVFPLFANVATFLIMSISVIGVIQSLMAKRRIRCACLGAVFNLPMSTITLIEDALMILMSGVMVAMHIV